jgi:hypothetical protein
MKHLLFGIFVMLCTGLFAQTENTDEGIIFETIILTPDYEEIATLAANLEAHNKEFHTAGTPYEAYVYNITTGPNSGKMVWMMGPFSKWADLDNRPGGEAHDENWMTTVVPYLENMEHGEYWKRDNEMSKAPTGKQYPLMFIRYHSISKAEGYRFGPLLEKISSVMKAMDEAESWAVYDNLLRQGYDTGRHVAMIGGMNNWAEMDEDWPFMDKFKEMYGDAAWNAFVSDMEVVTTNSWDEIWSYNAKLSGKE